MPQPADTSSTDGIVTVELLGQRYSIRSSLNPEQVGRLVTYVRGKLRSVSSRSPQGDLLRVAVLAALNIADDYFRCRDRRAGDDLTVINRDAGNRSPRRPRHRRRPLHPRRPGSALTHAGRRPRTDASARRPSSRGAARGSRVVRRPAVNLAPAADRVLRCKRRKTVRMCRVHRRTARGAAMMTMRLRIPCSTRDGLEARLSHCCIEVNRDASPCACLGPRKPGSDA